ncbi:MAG: hypothetical protein Q8N77_05710 [Nanoarchaeota archaeon]|nr:hypothetical protein [Nanoarchaeota archaeon]
MSVKDFISRTILSLIKRLWNIYSNKKRWVLIAFFIVILTSTANAGLIGWFKNLGTITGMGSTSNAVPNVTIGNTAPVVENITFQGSPSVTLSEAVPTPVIISFLAMDFDGASNIDNTTAYLNVSLDGSGMRQNTTGTCYPETEGSNATRQNYTCTVDMQYWDLGGSWTCAAEIKDSSAYAGLEVVNCFTVGTTTAINVTSDTIAWGNLAIGQVDSLMSTSELNITNTGNTNITNVTLQGIDLIGETTNTVWIPAANFTAPWGERSCNTGAALMNDTDLQLTGSMLDFGPGSLITTNNATHICLEDVGQDITQQSYSTAGDVEDWTLTGATGPV